MAAYVDQLSDHTARVRGTREGQVSTHWCHLTADTLDELHAMAARIGLKRAWYQPGRYQHLCHYDLTPARRARALALGAQDVQRLEHRRALRARGADLLEPA